MFKILIGVFLGYLFSESISENIPQAQSLKEKVISSVPLAKPATTEKPEEFTPKPAGAALFPAGQRFPIEMIQ